MVGFITRRIVMTLFLATEIERGPLPVLVAFGVMVGMRLRVVRNAGAMVRAPRPIIKRAMFLRRRFMMERWSSMGKTAMLLLEPAPQDIQSTLSNMEKANPHQNSFFLQLD